MHIHRFEKLWIGLSLLLIAGFIGIVLFGFTVMDLKVPGIEEGRQVDPTTVLSDREFSKPGVRKISDDHYEVYMIAQQFIFRPGSTQPLTIPANTKITFHMTAPDVMHGFEVPGSGLNATIIPGQIATFSTRFPEAKTYGIICHQYCGAAHHNMQGEINVVPPSEFDESNLISQ